MNSDDLLKYSLNCATHILGLVSPADFDNPTPCSEWDLRALTGHMLYEIAWVPDLLAGKTIAEVGDKYEGDLIGADLQSSWNKLAELAAQAITQIDPGSTVHLSYGNVSAEHYINEIGGDILIHAWDVGQAMQCSVWFEKNIAEDIYTMVLPRKDEFATSGLFGEPKPVPDNSPIQVKLLALFGREPKPVSSSGLL